MPVHSKIKNIIFDFGAVLINLDYQQTIDAFAKLGLQNFQNQFAYGQQQELFDQLERGSITEQDFFNQVRALGPLQANDEQIANAWNAMVLDFPAYRVELLLKLKKQYRVFLLSNTNEIHKLDFKTKLNAQYGYDVFDELFEKAYFSSELGMRKPEEVIYKLVLDTHQLKPSETLFIDDVRENLVPAQTLGIQTHWLSKGEEVTALFNL